MSYSTWHVTLSLFIEQKLSQNTEKKSGNQQDNDPKHSSKSFIIVTSAGQTVGALFHFFPLKTNHFDVLFFEFYQQETRYV